MELKMGRKRSSINNKQTGRNRPQITSARRPLEEVAATTMTTKTWTMWRTSRTWKTRMSSTTTTMPVKPKVMIMTTKTDS